MSIHHGPVGAFNGTYTTGRVLPISASLGDLSAVCIEIGSKQTIFYKPIQCARPSVIGIAAHIGAHGPYYIAAVHVAHINTYVQYEVRDLLHRAGNRKSRRRFSCRNRRRMHRRLADCCRARPPPRDRYRQRRNGLSPPAPCATAPQAFAGAPSRHWRSRRPRRPGCCR